MRTQRKTRLGNTLHRVRVRTFVRPCRNWSCKSADPGHDSHLTWLGRWHYSQML